MHYLRAAAALLLTAILLTAGGRSEPQRVSESEFLLGTAVTITVQEHRDARDAIRRAFERTREIQDKMSANDSAYDTTEIIRVNRYAGNRPVAVSEETFFVVSEALRFAELTGGAFDPTVLPLFRLWGMGTEDAAVPPVEKIFEVLELVDYEAVELDPEQRTVYLPRPGMALDLGGIAKGYAVNEAGRVLREAGIRHAILDYGGDIVTIGTRPDDTPWRIGVQHPNGRRGQFLGILESTDESVVSSGAYERYFTQNGTRYHHIFDPQTGYPSLAGLTSVTVVGADATTTDALSTAIFVMGLEDGLELIGSLPGYEAIIATENNRIYLTGDLSARFQRRADEYELVEVNPTAPR